MPKPRSNEALRHRHHAEIFAALGDETRLAMLARLSSGEPCAIVRLTDGTRLTRQAVTKHLRVLEQAGMVRSEKHGRENLFVLQPKPLLDARRALEKIAAQWDERLARLRTLLESEET